MQLRAGKAISRWYWNRRIGEFLKELEFTEGRSTGIPKIMRAMKENGSPPAEFEFDDDPSYFMVRLPVQPDAPQVATETARVATPGVTPEVTPEVGRLLSVCSHPLTRRKLQSALKLKDEKNFREKYLLPALASEVLEMTIPQKPQSRLQQYQLAAKGRTWLATKHATNNTH